MTDAVKIGNRNSKEDRQRVRDIRAAARAIVDLSAEIEPNDEDMPEMDEEKSLVYFGGELKSLGDGRFGGYLVRFGDPKNVDLTGDFFSKETDLGVEDGSSLPVYYNHGMDGVLKARKIGRGVIKYDDVGAWLDAQLELRDEYERYVQEMANEGKMGWSSGAAGHLVEREQIGKAWHIKTWPIAEASITPAPAEPRNSVVPLKSLLSNADPEAADGAAEQVGDKTNSTNVKSVKEVSTMEPDELKTAIAESVKEAVSEALKALPAVSPPPEPAVVRTDEPIFKSNADFFKSVQRAAYGDIDNRLLANQKANGLNETVPADGEFLVPKQTAAGIMSKMWDTGSLLSRFSPITVSGNNMTFNGVEETSRADGSRGGGILGYWMAEAGTKTKSKPQFEQVELKLKKVAALCYATDELLADVGALDSWINQFVPGELRFKVEDAIMNGTGAGMPLGMTASPALVTATRTDASEIDSLDVARMWARRYPGVNDYVWAGNANIFPQLINMTLGNMPIYMPPGGLSASPYGTILGRPFIETEYNPALGSVGDLLLFSPSQYAMITKGGVQAATSIHVQFVTDETAFRFVYRVDGKPFWKSAVTPYKGSDTISPFVALAATT